MSRVIDLTMPLAPGMRGVEITPKFTVAANGWNASTLSLYSHAGTHMDAQVHFEAGPETIDQHTPQRCMGRAWLVNLAGITPKALIEISSLGDVPKRFEPGDSLLLRTDWSKHAENPAIYRDGLPRISDALANWCVEKKVKLLGVEPPSIADVTNLPEVTRIHKILLGGGVTIVEGLCHLDRLNGPKIFFFALPLRIAQGDGCPCRAFAVDGEAETEQLATLLA
jgi:kynurenine formamidase